MKWNETTASQCRYGDNAKEVFGSWEILWEDSENDYQGHATILGKKGGAYVFYEWHYGSCSGCDTWEDAGLSHEAIEKEMRDTAMWFDSKKELKEWLDKLEGNPISNRGDGGLAGSLDILSGALRGRIEAVRKALGMPPLPEPKKETA